jgi:hypothetical protein
MAAFFAERAATEGRLRVGLDRPTTSAAPRAAAAVACTMERLRTA